jgi:GT2 family glycosyltransferase
MRSKLAVLPWVILLLPFDFFVVLGLLFGEICASLRKSVPPSLLDKVGNKTATVVIVNWDGKHLLAECLPSVIDAVDYAGGKHEILVVDNGSTDGSLEFVKQRFPEVHVLALNHNHGFGGGNNRGVEEIHTDTVVFLNNDMVVDRDFLNPLLRVLEDPSVFAVTSQIFFSDPNCRRQETGNTRARFEKGFFYFWHDEIQPGDENLKTISVFWAGGGSCAVDRRKFLAIGGFDPLYAPFYVEDADISYQAWKRGWKSLLAPASHVVHRHRSTSKKFGERFIENTIRRNMYLFIWKNLTDVSMLFEHLVNLPRTHLGGMLQNGAGFEFQAFIRAVFRLPAALTKRISNSPYYVLTDRDVIV